MPPIGSVPVDGSTDGSTDSGEPPQVDRTAEWDDLRRRYLAPRDERIATIGRGVHHQALISSDVERTIEFYQGLLGFPLTDLFENRDYTGSTHFFFDIGNGNCLAFFDFPGLELESYREVLGGHHHLAISVTQESWEAAKQRLLDADVDIWEHRTSIYFTGPTANDSNCWPIRSDTCTAATCSDAP